MYESVLTIKYLYGTLSYVYLLFAHIIFPYLLKVVLLLVLCVKLIFNLVEQACPLSAGTFSLLQNIVCCHRQAFKLAELFIRSEDNQTTMPLYVLLS